MDTNEIHVQFALCLDNTDYEASLELGKLYRVVADEQADKHGYLRVIDESGDDYAYQTERFHLLTLPETVEQTLLLAMA
ncbi:hypothetical protein [Promineifilum sp.]|uniref:hypothetical protein n=1 Tax=Promineifilum sp. TaxID=2664178 RepID=UPI0035B3E02E